MFVRVQGPQVQLPAGHGARLQSGWRHQPEAARGVLSRDANMPPSHSAVGVFEGGAWARKGWGRAPARTAAVPTVPSGHAAGDGVS